MNLSLTRSRSLGRSSVPLLAFWKASCYSYAQISTLFRGYLYNENNKNAFHSSVKHPDCVQQRNDIESNGGCSSSPSLSRKLSASPIDVKHSYRCLLHVVLISPRIPWNTGNIGRTCLGVGARLHVVNPLFTVDDKNAKRAGLDYWTEVDVRGYQDTSIEQFVSETLPVLGVPFFFTKFADQSIFDTSFFPRTSSSTPMPSSSSSLPTASPPGSLPDFEKIDNVVLVFGSEVEGLSDVPDQYMPPDQCVSFPMIQKSSSSTSNFASPSIRSFNLSTCVGSALFEAQRQLYQAHNLIDPRLLHEPEELTSHPSSSTRNVIGRVEQRKKEKGMSGKDHKKNIPVLHR